MDKTDQEITPSVVTPTEEKTNNMTPTQLDVVLEEPRPRRRRSLRGRILRALHIAEPFALVVGLGLLSSGVIEVVENRAPTQVDPLVATQLERVATPQTDRQQAFTGTADVRLANDSQRSPAPTGLGQATYSTTSISSTSNTSAEPPGIVGDGLESP